ncbi:hypothetical protein VCR1J2_450062 [Vibrio coralliirubri]|nr:hypothetical protein VCR1J2_450062 [Vibrio coralliirubri]CDT91786.1 hypothetical protein VCR8J2_450062 [Vibrio coralliirubri]
MALFSKKTSIQFWFCISQVHPNIKNIPNIIFTVITESKNMYAITAVAAGTQEKYVDTLVTVPDFKAFIRSIDESTEIRSDCQSNADMEILFTSNLNSLKIMVVGNSISVAEKH